MATNNFSVFAENGENILTPNDYTNDEQRINGVQSGLASSAVQNTSLKQVSAMTKAMADYMALKGQDADYTQPSALSGNLQTALDPLIVVVTRGSLIEGNMYDATIDTTYKDILAAHNAGRAVFMMPSNKQYILPLVSVESSYSVRFAGIFNGGDSQANVVLVEVYNDSSATLFQITLFGSGANAVFNRVNLARNPTAAMSAATKQYVDNTVQNSGNVSLVEYTSSGSFTFDSTTTTVSTATKISLPSNFAELASVKNLAFSFAVEGQSSSTTMDYSLRFFDAAGNQIQSFSASKEYEGSRGGAVYINLMNGYFLISTSNVGTQANINTRRSVDFSNCSYMTVSRGTYSSTTTSTVTLSIVAF